MYGQKEAEDVGEVRVLDIVYGHHTDGGTQSPYTGQKYSPFYE